MREKDRKSSNSRARRLFVMMTWVIGERLDVEEGGRILNQGLKATQEGKSGTMLRNHAALVRMALGQKGIDTQDSIQNPSGSPKIPGQMELETARHEFEIVLEERTKAKPGDAWIKNTYQSLGRTLLYAADLMARAGKNEEARSYADEAMKMLSQAEGNGETDMLWAGVRGVQAQCETDNDKKKKAIEDGRKKAEAVRTNAGDEKGYGYGLATIFLAQIECEAKNRAHALKHAHEAETLFESLGVPFHQRRSRELITYIERQVTE